MKTIILTFLIFISTLKLNAQSFSPFIYAREGTKIWNSIELFGEGAFFSIYNETQDKPFSTSLVYVNINLASGILSNMLNYSGNGKILKFDDRLIWTSTIHDYKNSYNGQFSVISKNSEKYGYYIIGDTSNEFHSINKFEKDILFSGFYRPATSQFGLSGFLARYRTNGEKVWEKYVRLNRNGFNTTFFDFVYQTRNNEILVIGRSFKTTPPGYRETQIITALFDSSGNLLEVKGELDSLGFRYDGIFRAYRLPHLNTITGTQLNDSTFCMLVYDNDGFGSFPGTWVFFNEKGSVIHHRKAWLYRDTLTNKDVFKQDLRGLVKQKGSNLFLAHTYFYDSIDPQRMIVLDQDLYLKKVYPGIEQYHNKNITAGLCAFVEDVDNSIYQLRFLAVDSITKLDYYGSLVCKVDSNGNLLSNGPIFPVGMSENLNTLGIKLFPNPTKDKINIVIPNSTHLKLEIYNLNGNLIETHELQQSTTYTSSNLLSGLYWFRFSDSSGNTHTEKIWVE